MRSSQNPLLTHMWGRGIAPVPSGYFHETLRLGPVRSLDHQTVSKVDILLCDKGGRLQTYQFGSRE